MDEANLPHRASDDAFAPAFRTSDLFDTNNTNSRVNSRRSDSVMSHRRPPDADFLMVKIYTDDTPRQLGKSASFRGLREGVKCQICTASSRLGLCFGASLGRRIPSCIRSRACRGRSRRFTLSLLYLPPLHIGANEGARLHRRLVPRVICRS